MYLLIAFAPKDSAHTLAHMGHIIIMFDGPNDMNWDLLSGALPGMVSSSQYSRAYKRLEEACM